jgi:hypothetical protein
MSIRRPNRPGKPPVQMKVDLSAFNSMIDGLERDVTAAIRPAAQAGAEVFYRAVMQNVNALGRETGRLGDAIYQAYATKESTNTKARYDVSWNHRKAPHALLVEYGHIQRYAVNMADDGRFYTVVRPSMRGKPMPKSDASQAVKDAYFVLLEGGPKQVAARPFMRPAFYRQGEAFAAVQAKFFEVLNAK